jgi:hypothetical protein
MRASFKKRLRYLWTFELLNALVVFPLLYYVISLQYRLGWFSLAALLVVCMLLVVGAAYWFLKSRALDGSRLLYQPGTRRFFRGCKRVFGFVVLALVGLFGLRAFGQSGAALAELVTGGGLTLMALLEYINYYHVQLSYDNRADLRYLLTHRRLKRAVMVRDLDI